MGSGVALLLWPLTLLLGAEGFKNVYIVALREIRMKIVLEEDYTMALAKAQEVLKGGGIMVYPTETLYGIGGNALDEKVIGRVRELKGREGDKPFSAIMGNMGMVSEYCKTGGLEEILLANLPGPYTFLLEEKKPVPFSHNGKIGVRVPLHHFIRKVVGEAGVPLLGTSANLSGGKPPASFGDVPAELVAAADLAIDGGATHCQAPSTVVDLVEKRVVREGAGEFAFRNE